MSSEIKQGQKDTSENMLNAVNVHLTLEQIAANALHSKGIIEGLQAVLEMDLGEDVDE